MTEEKKNIPPDEFIKMVPSSAAYKTRTKPDNVTKVFSISVQKFDMTHRRWREVAGWRLVVHEGDENDPAEKSPDGC